jgi:hypothetical protein
LNYLREILHNISLSFSDVLRYSGLVMALRALNPAGCESCAVVVVIGLEPPPDEISGEFHIVVVGVDGLTTLELLFPEVPPTAPPTTAPMTRRVTRAISNLPLIILQNGTVLMASACGAPPSFSKLTALAPGPWLVPASTGSPAVEGKDGPAPVCGVRGGGATGRD